MTQVRVMGGDAEQVGRVLALMLPVLQAHPGLQVGDPQELGMRGEGRRVVFDVTPAARPASADQAREAFLAAAAAVIEQHGEAIEARAAATPPPQR